MQEKWKWACIETSMAYKYEFKIDSKPKMYKSFKLIHHNLEQ